MHSISSDSTDDGAAPRPPDDTGLLDISTDYGRRIFEVKPPSTGRLWRESGPAPVLAALLFAGLIASGVFPQSGAAIGMSFVVVAIFALALWYHAWRVHNLYIRIVADEEYLRFDADDRGREVTIELTEQPRELYCRNTGRLRMPLAAHELIVVTAEHRLPIGRYLSRAEVEYLCEALCRITGWRKRVSVDLVGHLWRLLIAGVSTVPIAYALAPLVVRLHISPTLWQGRLYAAFVAFFAVLCIINAFDEMRRRRSG